ncbi:MAG TPA: P-loop NTPase [Firmicutes bacterium]|nr:P-loop NTPase [Bacillota bacterium]
MKEVAVISGKGGVGKTSLVASLASLAAAGHRLVLADCDVDAPDLHLLLHPELREVHEFRASHKAFVDPESCLQCGRCAAYCRFDAIHAGQVDPLSCEGCGVCQWVCPVGAITLREELSGRWFISSTRYGPMVHAQMEPGEENSGRLVTLIRQGARKVAEREEAGLVLTDGPPGIGCPVIATLSGVDLALVVTEPTVSGVHDLKRVLDLCQHFRVPAVACINRYDLHSEGTDVIKNECHSRGLTIIGYLPYDPTATAAIRQGRPVVEFPDSHLAVAVKEMWGRLEAFILALSSPDF